MLVAETFGAAFGRLVKAKRGKDWTQSSLAAAMFPNQEDAGEKRKGDISKLENGKVANPDARTIALVAGVLGIADAEIDALRKQVQMSPQEQLDAVPTLSRNELELLATRFELERAFEKSDAELRGFLNNKAEEYRTYKAEIEAIDERTRGLGNLKAAARAAADDLNFEEVESLLSMVQEAELEVAAETADLRARNALLRGRAEQAYTLLTAAADSFAAVDPLEPAQRRLRYEDLLYQHGLRYGGAGLSLSAKMIAGALASLDENSTPQLWAAAQNSLAIALRNQGTRTVGAEGGALLAEAVTAYRAALRVRTEADHPVDWAMTMQNLAGALQEQGKRTAGAEGAALLAEAVAAYRDAQRVYTEADHPVNWATTMQNLAIALRNQGTRSAGAEGAALLEEAVAAYRAALRVLTEADHPVDWAGTMQNLANALQEQGKRTAGAEGAALLAEAVTAYRAALRVRTEADHPVDWAMTRENMALLEVARADHDTCTDPRPHLTAALDHVESALTVYDPQHMPYDYGTATELRDAVKTRLAAL